MNKREVAEIIITRLGGKENINLVTHCATRLRFDIKNRQKIQEDELNNMNEVLGIVDKGGQYQLVIGPSVADLYNELYPLLGNETAVEQVVEEKVDDENWFTKMLNYISGSISPVLPVIIGAGMLNAILSICTLFGLETDSGTYKTLSTIASAGFTYLPVFVAFAAARKIKVDEYIASFIALAMVVGFNQIDGLSLFGIAIQNVKYTNSIIPALAMVPCLKIIDMMISKVLPSQAHFTIKPVILVVAIAPITLFVLGPIGSLIGTMLANFCIWLMDTVGALSMAAMAGLHNITVMFGVHYLYTPIMANELAETGATFVLTRALCANYAAAGATLAVALKAKKSENKQVGFSSCVTAILGVTEPALFGVLIRLKKPLIASCLAAACSGIIAGFMSLKAFAIASPGLLALPIYIAPGENGIMNLVMAIGVVVLSIVLGFVFTWIMGFKED